MKTVRDVCVKDVEKRKSPTKHYVYIIEVTWSEGTITTIYRRYSDFFEFQCKLLELFPQEAGAKDPSTRMIPFLPGKIFMGRSHIRSVAEKRMEKINEYCKALVRLPPKISDCEFVLNFFEVTPDDITPPEEQVTAKGMPGGQIESISEPLVLERYVAIADYVKQKKNECSLKEGQTVEVIDKNQNGWWFVNLDDCNEGWVPATYLEPLYGTEEAQSEVLKPGEEQTHITTAAYKAQNDDEISFEKGVLVEVTEKNVDGWWKARYGGKEGYIPAAYLTRYRGAPVQGRVGPTESVKEAVLSTAGYKTKQPDLTVSHAPSPKQTVYDDEPIYCHIPRKKSIDKKPLKDMLGKSEQRAPPEVPRAPAQTASKQQEEGAAHHPGDECEEAPQELFVTLADFSATAGDGLSFKAGETVSVVTKNQSGWWYVEMKDHEGWVPSSYLEKVKSPAPASSKVTSDSKTPRPEAIAKKPEVINKKPEVAITHSSPTSTPSPSSTPTPSPTSPPHTTVMKTQSFVDDLKVQATSTKPKVTAKTPSSIKHNLSSLKKSRSNENLLETSDNMSSIQNMSDGVGSISKPSVSINKKPAVLETENATHPPVSSKPGAPPKPAPRKPACPEPQDQPDSLPRPQAPALQQLSLENAIKHPSLKKVMSSDITKPSQKVQLNSSRSASMVKPDTKPDVVRPDTKPDVVRPDTKPDVVRPDTKNTKNPPHSAGTAEKTTPPQRPNPPTVQKNRVPPPRPANSPAVVRKSTYTTICDYEGGMEGCVEFKEGEKVTDVMEKKADGWWFIRIGSREGWAPSTFLEETKPNAKPPRPETAPPPKQTQAVPPVKQTQAVPPVKQTLKSAGGIPKKPSTIVFKAIDNYCASSSEDSCIDLVKGMMYEVIEKADGWWFVRGSDNREGWVPSTYLESS